MTVLGAVRRPLTSLEVSQNGRVVGILYPKVRAVDTSQQLTLQID